MLVLEVLERINRELGTTTVVITHNAAIAGMADRVIRLARRAHRGDRAATPARRPAGAALVSDASTASCWRDLWPCCAGRCSRSRWWSPCGVATMVDGAARSYAVARAARATATTPSTASPTCSRASSARPRRWRERVRAMPGVRGGRDARRRRRRDARGRRASTSRSPDGWSRCPTPREPALNALYLRRGRLPEPGRDDEVVVERGLRRGARARSPATRSVAMLNGRRQRLRIVGIGAVARVRLRDPARRRVPRLRALRRAVDEPRARSRRRSTWTAPSTTWRSRSTPGARERDVIDRARPAARAATAASARTAARTSISHRFLDEEIGQLPRDDGACSPPIFLGVAAFLLNVVLARLVGDAARADRRAQGVRLQPRRGRRCTTRSWRC